MIVLLLLLVILLGIYDIWKIRKTNCKRDLYVYIGSMILVTAFGIVYMSKRDLRSVADIVMQLFNIKG